MLDRRPGTGGGHGGGGNGVAKGGWWGVVQGAGRLLRSPWLAVSLLVAFLLVCLLGNVVPQLGTAGTEEVNAWQAAHPVAGRWVRVIDGFRTFQTTWFLVLVSLLALNTLACTLDQLSRARRKGTPLGSVEGEAVVLPPSARDIRLNLAPEEAARAVARVLRRFGLPVRRRKGYLSAELTLGRWGSPFFHLGLVLVFLAAVAGTQMQWNIPVPLAEGAVFDPGRQSTHGLTRAPWAREPHPAELPQVTLVAHHPRYWMKGYAPDSASEVLVDEKPQLLRYGAPLTVRGFSLHQQRRYGALVEVVLRPAGPGGSVPPQGAKSAQAAEPGPPPLVGGPFPEPDGTLRAGLPFEGGRDPVAQRRLMDLGPAGATGLFRLLPGPEAANYALPLARRFQLAVALAPSGQEPGPGTRETRLWVGESLSVERWLLEFRSVRYWTYLRLSSAPFTPFFFALAWWCVLALALVVLWPERRVFVALDPVAPPEGGTRVRVQAVGGRGAVDFPQRLAEALQQLAKEGRR